MATGTTNYLHEIQMDSESEDDSDMEIDEINSSDTDSDESDDEDAPPKKQSTNRNWSKTAFEPHLFHFGEQNSGVSLDTHAMKGGTPLDFFELLFDEKRIDLIVKETNTYQNIFTNNATHKTTSHQAKWTQTNRSEIYTFLATVMLMSVTKKIRSSTTGQQIQ